ncbi:uncharacterized protein LOC128553429 [Mercenaria mercenaria]|uniref:uncharacterized protein LOC128553429 n=1 Tax=Mercenaria mercenaria TaxID=6596 RepID=UPI00234EC8D7|nr:uncharacterized protein LOC128553429 [Mercenaria mercenaria]
MAVAGRKTETKLSAIGTSLNISHNCGPCETDKDHIEAYGYCIDCEDYLCNVCFKSHGKNKASRHHTLLTYDEISTENVSQLKTSTCTDICTVHKKESVKFFCSKHKVLGCNDCMTLGHRTCVIQYIPDKCKGISDSLEYKTTVSYLAQELEEINSHIVKVNVKDGIAESMHDQCIKEINNFQTQLNERIDQLRIQIQNDADKIKSKNKEDIQKVVNALHEKKSRLEQAEFDINKHKTANQEGQLFISIKRAQSVLREKERNVSHMSVTNENMLYKFEPSHRLRSILAEPDIFGKLNPQYPESVENLGHGPHHGTINEKPENKTGEPEMLVTEEKQTKIVVSNLPSSVHVEVLEMFFENTRKYGGGPVFHVDIDEANGTATVEFEEPEAVDIVLNKCPIMMLGQKVEVTVYKPEPPVPRSTIEVTGPCSIVCTEQLETLEMCFECFRRSGGGDVCDCRFDEENNMALVTFENEEVALRVQERVGHVIAKQKVSVALHTPSKQSKKSDKVKEKDKENEQSTKTIKVKGVDKSASIDTVEFYFENTRRSGGGEIEDIIRDEEEEDVIYITFKNQTDAERVVSKGNHNVEGKTLSVSLYTPSIPDASFDIPKHWQSMKDKENLKLVTLNQRDTEYSKVVSEFTKTLGRRPNIVKIERVQNKTLYTQYAAKRKEMNVYNPYKKDNEKILWHGTADYAVPSINSHGFNRSYCSNNVTAIGQGVYFAVNANYVDQAIYTPPGSDGNKRMYRCLVLTGNYCNGSCNMRAPPIIDISKPRIFYDSVTNSTGNPIMFVVFNDTQAYPEHLITYR